MMAPPTAVASVELVSFGVGLPHPTPNTPAPQTWTAVTSGGFAASTALLLTDGTVMVQQKHTGAWWQLTPDAAGSYINGHWSQLASTPSGYAPLYYASAVLPDGRVVVEGDEYNFSGSQAQLAGPVPPLSYLQTSSPQPTWSNLGAIYDPVANIWTSITPPPGWNKIGDAAGAVLENGTFMLAGFFYYQVAFLNSVNLSWTVTTPPGKADNYDEEGWTLLPNGELLTVDAWLASSSEIYSHGTNSWSNGGSTVVNLASLSPCNEVGPAVLRPNGSVFALGATRNTAIYNTTTGYWSAGPTLPPGLGVADGPAALLPNSKVLVDASPTSPSNCFGIGSQFFVFDGSTLTPVPAPPTAPGKRSYEGRMLVLPTGQVLFTDESYSVAVYTPAGTYQPAWQPTITSVPAVLTRGTANYVIAGTQLNGLSQGAQYGDDAQMATNFPLVRITNSVTGTVQYAKTHSFSTMAVATGSAIVSAEFDVPDTIEVGSSTLVVVANGIPSEPVNVNIVANVPTCAPDGIFCDGFE